MYTYTNFRTKKQFKEAVASGRKVGLYSPGLGTPKQDGIEYVEGPHYPAPHTWYAKVTVKDGIVTKVMNPGKKWHQERVKTLLDRADNEGSLLKYRDRISEANFALSQYREKNPAKSKAQQRLFGIALAMKRGKVPYSYSPDAARIARTMSTGKIREFARMNLDNPFFPDLGVAATLGAGFTAGSILTNKLIKRLERGIGVKPGKDNPLYGFVGFWRGKRFETYATSIYEAQIKMAKEHNIKKPHEISVILAEKDGKPVTHLPLFNPRTMKYESQWKVVYRLKKGRKKYSFISDGTSGRDAFDYFEKLYPHITDNMVYIGATRVGDQALDTNNPGRSAASVFEWVKSRFYNPQRKDTKTILKCMFCGKVFKRVIGPRTFEIKCPKCKETDVDVIGNPILKWNDLHPLAREEILQGAGLNIKLAKKKWNELDGWIQQILKDSLLRRSKGKVTVENPLVPVHPLAIEAKKKYLEDVKAGHGKGEEYWAGAAGTAFLMSNPYALKKISSDLWLMTINGENAAHIQATTEKDANRKARVIYKRAIWLGIAEKNVKGRRVMARNNEMDTYSVGVYNHTRPGYQTLHVQASTSALARDKVRKAFRGDKITIEHVKKLKGGKMRRNSLAEVVAGIQASNPKVQVFKDVDAKGRTVYRIRGPNPVIDSIITGLSMGVGLGGGLFLAKKLSKRIKIK